MNEHLKGVIIHTTQYREHDLICTVIFEDDIRRSLVVRGATKANSKTAMYSLIGYTYDYFLDLNDNRDMQTFKGADLVKSRLNMTNDIIRIAMLNVLNECADKATFENDKITGLYKLVVFALDGIDQNNDRLILAFFIAKLLDYSGISPYVDGCVICDDKNISGFSIRDGGFLCEAHQHLKDTDLTIEELKEIRYLAKAKLKDYEILKSCIKHADHLLEILISFLTVHGGSDIKSYEFLKNVI